MKTFRFLLIGLLLASPAWAQFSGRSGIYGQGGGGGAATGLTFGVTTQTITTPGATASGLCIVSTGSGPYQWSAGACSGSAATAFSALTGSTNTTAAMVIGSGASLAVTGTGTNAATGFSMPATLTGTVTSGGMPYFSSTTALTSSGVLGLNALIVGGGAGGSPGTGSGDFTYATHTLTMGAAGLLNLSAGVATGFTLPAGAGFAPTVDGQIATNTTNHTLVYGGNGTALVSAVAATGTNTATTCTNQVITAISGIAAPTCSTVANAALSNSAITIGGTSVSLGSSTSSFPNPGAIGGTTPATGAFTTLSATGQFTSTLATGTAPFAVTSTTAVANLSIGGTAATATNVAGGGTGGVEYQSAANTSTFLASPTTSGHIFALAWEPIGSALAPVALDLATYLGSPANIGGTSAASGAFTTLSASSTVSGTGFSTYLASPPAIGGSAAAAGAFTTLSGSSTITFSGISGSTQCLHVNSSGVVTGTSADCGAVASLSGDGTIITNSASTGAVTLTIAGTSGGVPCFSSGSAWKSSAALTSTDLMVGGGAGNCPTVGNGDFTYATHTLASGASGILDLHSATGTAAFKVPSNSSNTATAAGVIDFDTSNTNFHIYANGADSIIAPFLASGSYSNNDCVKILVASGNLTLGDAGSACGSGGGSSALSSITAATGNNTIASGNNYNQIWNWALTSNGVTAMTFGETTAATGTGTNYIGQFSTKTGSTATPLNITSSLSGSQTLPSLSITPTWNTTGVVDAGILENVVNTASGANSLLLDLQVGGSSEFKVDTSGNITNGGTLTTGGTTSGIAMDCQTAATATSGFLGFTPPSSCSSGYGFYNLPTLPATAGPLVAGVASSNISAITVGTTTGSGNYVLSTSPALTTPNLGVPSAVTLTNATGLPCGALPALTGDATTSAASCATSVVAIEGGTIPASAGVLGTNSSRQPVAATAANVSSIYYIGGGGTAQAQTATLSPAVGSLTNGLVVNWLPLHANTGSGTTLAVNGLSAITIVKTGGSAVAANDLTTTAIATAIYDGTNFELQNPQTSGSSSGTVGNCSVADSVTYYSSTGTTVACTSEAGLDQYTYVAGGGTANAQTATLAPALGAYAAGVRVEWIPTAANTTTATLNVNGLGAKTLDKCGTSALVASDLTTTAVAVAIYDGTEFQLQNPQQVICGTVPNGSLASSAITIAGTSVALGSSTSSLPSPGAIGGTTAAAANFTTVGATGLGTFSAAGAASTAGLTVTGAPYTGGSATTNFPQFYVNDGTGPTTFSGNGTEFGVNSPSGFTGNFLDFHVNGGSSVASINYQGNGLFAGTLGVTGHVTLEGVTSTGATGTGNLVFSVSPTITGTLTAQNGSSFGGTAYSYGAPSTTGGAAVIVPATTYTVTGSATTANFQGEYHGVKTFTDASAGTITDLFGTLFSGPAAGAGSLTVTRAHTFGIVDSTSAASSITGGFIVATTLGTAATSVGIGGGNINAGGTGTFGGALSADGLSYPTSLTSGGACYASSTSAIACGGILNTNILVKGGGAGAAPTNSGITDNGTNITSSENLLLTGVMDGLAPITNTTGTTATLGAATYQSGYTFNQEATAATGVTYTLPATVKGAQYCVANSIVSGTGAADTGVLTVYPPSGSYVILKGVINTIGGGGTHGVASGGAAADAACFVANDATHWTVFPSSGIWTAN